MKSLRNQDGLISIVALGIFMVLTLFGILVQQNVMDTYQAVRNMNNYDSANDLADSVLELLQYEVNNHESGYNTLSLAGDDSTITCEFNTDAVGAGETQHSFCAEFVDLVGEKPTTISLTVKSRAEAASVKDDTLATGQCNLRFGGGGDCFVVPTPGTGDAGSSRCSLYTPNYDASVAAASFVDPDLTGVENIDQLDYPCNWDRLSLGSGLTDRVTIPLYYEDSSGNIINTFNGGNGTSFQLRMRTPCLPCGAPGTPGTRDCAESQDSTVCTAPSERYYLDTTHNDVVVQWQLTGICGDEVCGVMGVPDDKTYKSAIHESMVFPTDDVVVLSNTKSVGIKMNLDSSYSSENTVRINDVLRGLNTETAIEKPVLTLFLSQPLISNEEKNVPYLEYQFLSDSPVSDSKIIIQAIVNVDGNYYEKTLYKEAKKELVDYAVQN